MPTQTDDRVTDDLVYYLRGNPGPMSNKLQRQLREQRQVALQESRRRRSPDFDAMNADQLAEFLRR